MFADVRRRSASFVQFVAARRGLGGVDTRHLLFPYGVVFSIIWISKYGGDYHRFNATAALRVFSFYPSLSFFFLLSSIIINRMRLYRLRFLVTS